MPKRTVVLVFTSFGTEGPVLDRVTTSRTSKGEEEGLHAPPSPSGRYGTPTVLLVLQGQPTTEERHGPLPGPSNFT